MILVLYKMYRIYFICEWIRFFQGILRFVNRITESIPRQRCIKTGMVMLINVENLFFLVPPQCFKFFLMSIANF